MEEVWEHFDATQKVAKTSGEEAMYGPLEQALTLLCPSGFAAKTLLSGNAKKPDLSLMHLASNAVTAFIEVKKPTTVADAFKVAPGEAQHQIADYRDLDPGAVLLTDGQQWWDVTESDDLSQPFAQIDLDADSASIEASIRTLSDKLSLLANRRPRYASTRAAAVGIGSVVQRLDAHPSNEISNGWSIIRAGLGLEAGSTETLDASGSGEVVAFALLALAVTLEPLDDDSFVQSALEEWDEALKVSTQGIPPTLAETFDRFRLHALTTGSVAPDAWLTTRAIARWVRHKNADTMWARLSDLWDTHLHRTGRRQSLGSWQTPKAVADFQVDEVSAALEELGYDGLTDSSVTALDPCVGTGVYLSSIVDFIVARGLPAETVNASEGTPFPRILGVDISSTAVATSHIRLAAGGAKPALFLTDTLSTGVDQAAMSLFDTSDVHNAIVSAAASDREQVGLWASRNAKRPPVLAIIGNPPYERGGLDIERYEELGWVTSSYTPWTTGSGGGSAIRDPYIGFWAWASMVCQQSCEDLDVKSPFGVISFITNRTWIEGRSFATMRRWIAERAASITITDFGPGPQAGGAGMWSPQPFKIEAGTAIATVLFDGARNGAAEITYRRGFWDSDGGVSVLDERIVQPVEVIVAGKAPAAVTLGHRPWTNMEEAKSLLDGISTTSGIQTAGDADWVKLAADRDFGTRYAYRMFDNRWAPTSPPPKATSLKAMQPGESSPNAEWRLSKLFGPHRGHTKTGGWYAVLPTSRSKPGPAIHPTVHLPDLNFFTTRGGKVVRVTSDAPIPDGFGDWATSLDLDGDAFWRYMVAAGHHRGYWTPGHRLADQLLSQQIDPPRSIDPTVVSQLVALGLELISVWSVDTMKPANHRWEDGGWVFEGEAAAEAIEIHGPSALRKWRQGRGDQDQWAPSTAEWYARTITAILRATEIADEVASLLVVED